MTGEENRRYRISEVSRLTDVPAHVLREWEDRFAQLKPNRDRAGRRYYTAKDIELIRLIRRLLWVDKLTSEGVRKVLREGRGRSERLAVKQEVIDLVDEIEHDIREMIDLLDSG